MQKKDVGIVRPVGRCALIVLILLTTLGADECPERMTNRALAEMLRLLPQTEWGEIDIRDLQHLRIHKYPQTIQKGDTVQPFTLHTAAATDSLICQSDSGCLLFFVDTDHYAHFAHDTVVALWRLDNKTFQEPALGQWWPLLNGKPIFDTVREREDWKDELDPDPFWTIVYPRDFPRDSIPDFRDTDPAGFRVRHTRSHRLVAADTTPEGPGDAEACTSWAVIVNGYDDPEDTFHIDTGGMYELLKGHGVPDDQIFYLCPEPDDSDGCDTKVHRDELEEILTKKLGEDISGQPLADSPCQNLLLFYSSHGSSGALYCGRCAACDAVAHATLKDWLDKVHCANITVVVEACKSGSLLNKLEATPPAGQTRYVFTSTSDRDASYRDVDKIVDNEDKNPGDIGSETVWGYVEGVAASSGDANGDAKIQFAEAFEYAKDNDITTLTGNEPQMHDGGGTIGAVPSCAAGPGTDALEIQLTQENPVGRADWGQILRCRCNHLMAVVTGVPGGGPAKPPPVAKATFYWTDTPWTESSEPKWKPSETGNDFGDFKEIRDSTRLLAIDGGIHTIPLDWETGTKIDAGSVMTVLAVVDTPSSAIADTEMSISEMEDENWASAIRLEVINPSSCFLFPCKGGNRRCEP